MAQKYLVQLVDDLTQAPIEDGAGESIVFALDGASYAIDLTGEHAAEFRALLEPYVAAARKADRAPAPVRSPRPATPKQDLKAVREWASANGYAVSDRGRVPNEVQKAYAASNLIGPPAPAGRTIAMRGAVTTGGHHLGVVGRRID